MPADLLRAISHGNRVLDWYDNENLSSEEMPPEWMWPFEDSLNSWFEQIKADREQKYGSSSGSDSRETVPMMENEYAHERG